MQLRTKPFTIPRIIFARLSAELYVRRFWYLILPWPLMAVGLILLSRDRNIIFLALLVGLWPLTLPLRAFFMTSKTARLFESPTYVTMDEENLYFHPQAGQGMKVARGRINSVVELHGYLAIIVGLVKFAFIPVQAFDSPKQVAKLKSAPGS